MQSLSQPIAQDLVFIGGGHSHAIALKQLGMEPLPGVRVTLITDVSHTPYSGMLPGYVAGLYDFDDCHIDLRPLSQFAQAHMIVDRAIGLDLDNNRVQLANHPSIAFDLLSIDIGSTPTDVSVTGASEYAIPVKPIAQFLRYWDQVVASVIQNPERPIRVAIVGGGAGGVELTLAIQSRLSDIYRNVQLPDRHLEIHLLHRGCHLIPERNAWVGDRLQQLLLRRDVCLHLGETVSSIEPSEGITTGGDQEKLLRCKSGLTIACDYVFWVTQASAASWLRESGLATDDRGFIQVSETLRSVSHPQVFAAGDVATMVKHPRPKAGVFAVRQGTPLVQNLRRVLLDQSPRSFVPQKEFLILIGTGDRSAIASRSTFGFGPHPLIWRWKDWIDRQFMIKFSNLKPMTAPDSATDLSFTHSKLKTQNPSPPTMRCAGCGSKVGSSVLTRVLTRIKQEQCAAEREDVLIGLDDADDAAVVKVPVGQVMVQTIDYFPALINDPFLFGQIAANHCLSDIFAMGAAPQSGLAIATLPYAVETKLEETLYQLLSGAVNVLNQVNASLIGGHTIEGSELALGLACNGLATVDRLWRKRGMVPGQVLILTKALGTGILFAADMRLKAKGRWIEDAIRSMILSNQAAVVSLREHQTTACTDVTGFGLLGHLLEMVNASRVAVELNLNAIPALDGTKETIQQGIHSSLYPQNLSAARSIANLANVRDRPLYPILFDPQTSGGLLAAVPGDRAEACLAALQSQGYSQSRIIGRVLPQRGERSILIQE
ncbi:MAG: selenide, water dikinase SelD [Cyanobacteria bacterium CRU_2_1]|nr:selenide, water dikinase SelD [Cyanobacteria bacterium RU_5_0]NJR58647.1 selenide, water dikinase SelD [Cyanobacteria bacterium CRU_2_1]